jgi:hypothetical protein
VVSYFRNSAQVYTNAQADNYSSNRKLSPLPTKRCTKRVQHRSISVNIPANREKRNGGKRRRKRRTEEKVWWVLTVIMNDCRYMEDIKMLSRYAIILLLFWLSKLLDVYQLLIVGASSYPKSRL